LERKIITTLDGSTTIQLVDWDECYHSKNGAIQEAYHVFIQNGFTFFSKKNSISILEIGFGTGLNALITSIEAQKSKQKVVYTGVEAYPVSFEEAKAMNYCKQLDVSNEVFNLLHFSEWEQVHQITPNFSLLKKKQFFQDINDHSCYDLIYFDAFGYPSQPELWSEEIFKKMFLALKNEGVLVTYAARGVVKRALEASGFKVKKVPGPPGKREMMIAFKNFLSNI
jgi:tRNA U34 5-methylaminomethyl-2-thiouridine-forming methyltransferase MnmC